MAPQSLRSSFGQPHAAADEVNNSTITPYAYILSALLVGCAVGPFKANHLPNETNAIDKLIRGARADLPGAKEGLPTFSGTAFFECTRCNTLHGFSPVGYYGLVKRAPQSCEHHWIRLRSKREFKQRFERLWPGALERMSDPCGFGRSYWKDARQPPIAPPAVGLTLLARFRSS